jgi:hypothetical protein
MFVEIFWKNDGKMYGEGIAKKITCKYINWKLRVGHATWRGRVGCKWIQKFKPNYQGNQGATTITKMECSSLA